MDEEKPLSSIEQREKMKEEFKKDLQMRKEFLNKVKGLRNTSNINKALSNMNVEDDTDEWVNKLNQESAFMEAKSELALEVGEEVKQKIEQVRSDEEMKKILAAEMVEQIKREMTEEKKVVELGDIVKEVPIDEQKDSPAPKPRKTLGDLEL